MNLNSVLKPILEEEGGTTDTLYKKKQLQKQEWNKFYDTMDIVNGTPIYSIMNHEPIVLLIHGAGHCAMTFALLCQELKTFCSCITYDLMQHGQSLKTESLEMDNLIKECEDVIDYIRLNNPNTNILLLGHSLGAAIACKLKPKSFIRGLIVIDMIESKAIESIKLMEQELRKRPSQFYSYSSAISYHLSNNLIKNPQSAQITVPHYLNDNLEWKVDLIQTKKYWQQWFQGIQNGFDNFPYSKLLFVAEMNRLCSIQFKQNKYTIHLFDKSGHSMHEDQPERMAKHISDFIFQEKIPINSKEIEQLNNQGVQNFESKALQYDKQLKNII
ncbi:unnamed protein product [Paramecium primaurelia]|uniref:Protein phosphatase methylesterase 1 n=1 Tax=Paramecium primaurelia TaxID=5886 RepID=A0A8S1N6W0_PARPR|nr:unnamed protein product [Paramecium primaurelia]